MKDRRQEGENKWGQCDKQQSKSGEKEKEKERREEKEVE